MRHASALVRDRDSAHDLDEVARWLADRDDVCRDEATSWMIRGTSLSTDTLANLWSDRMWSHSLTDLVIETADGDLSDDPAESARGFLRGVSAGRGVGIVGLDGSTQWVTRRRWVIAHPATLPDLGGWINAARELGISQDVHQLDRTVFHRDASRFPDSHIAAHLWLPGTSRTERSEQFWDGGRWVLAHIGKSRADGYLSVEFRDSDDRPLRLAAVGPIVWSEALRLATA